MKKLIVITLIVLGIVVWYSFITVSRHAEEYIPEVAELQDKTGASSIILVDFTRASCADRLFVFDNGKPVYSGAVLHGNGKGNTPTQPIFSNKPGSKCSCLGLFKIISRGTMRNGYPCLTLEGLSPTNSNAKSRGILVHPSVMVSLLPFEVEYGYFPLTDASNGCFAVSFHTFSVIEKLNAPVYLYAKYNK